LKRKSKTQGDNEPLRKEKKGGNMFTDLTIAVIQQMGYDPKSPPDELFSTMADIENYGAAAGFHGFIYYHETSAFYDANEAAIWDALDEDADAFGESTLQFIAGFRDAHQITHIASFKNLLAWYALERAASEAELAVGDAILRAMINVRDGGIRQLEEDSESEAN
jgi:hypothetical protein